MKILVLGGTGLVGRQVTQVLVDAGHDVTAMSRSGSMKQPVDGVRYVAAPRERMGELASAQDWDVVVDLCAYTAADLQLVTDSLRSSASRYVLVSSISAYAKTFPGFNESTPLHGESENLVPNPYGAAKAAAEKALLEGHFGARACILRPCLIAGPWDGTHRFSYWVARALNASYGSVVLAAGDPHAFVQYIDARDLALFVLKSLEEELTGAFNVAYPRQTLRRSQLLDACLSLSPRKLEVKWVDDSLAQRLKLEPWRDMPLWLPADGDYANFMDCDSSKALASGLSVRPVQDTIRGIAEWMEQAPTERMVSAKAGLTPERELSLLSEL